MKFKSRGFLIYSEGLEPGYHEGYIDFFVQRTITPTDLQRCHSTDACVYLVEFEEANKINVLKNLGAYRKEDSATLSKYLNKMRDISFCNNEECARRKTCKAFIGNLQDKNAIVSQILVKDSSKCAYYYPKFMPEYVGCKLKCPKKCKRKKIREFTINNEDWTETDVRYCPYYLGE